MRTFIIVLLLIAASYWLYTKYPPHTSDDELPAEIAWREITRDQRGVVTSILVVAISGNR